MFRVFFPRVLYMLPCSDPAGLHCDKGWHCWYTRIVVFSTWHHTCVASCTLCRWVLHQCWRASMQPSFFFWRRGAGPSMPTQKQGLKKLLKNNGSWLCFLTVNLAIRFPFRCLLIGLSSTYALSFFMAMHKMGFTGNVLTLWKELFGASTNWTKIVIGTMQSGVDAGSSRILLAGSLASQAVVIVTSTTFSWENHRVVVFLLPLLMAWTSKDLDHKLTRGLDQLASGSVGSGSFFSFLIVLKQLKLQSKNSLYMILCTCRVLSFVLLRW